MLGKKNEKAMKATDQTLQQIERALRRMSEKFPPSEEASVMTDIHVRVTQETGELMMFDDDDNELTRCVVEQWIDNKDDDFYAQITPIVRRCIEKMKKLTENLGLLKPYSFVLEDDEKEAVTELYVVDDDTVIIDPDLMEGLEEDLDKFLDNLLKEE